MHLVCVCVVMCVGGRGKGIYVFPHHVGMRKGSLVSTVCACANNPMKSWGIVYHRL